MMMRDACEHEFVGKRTTRELMTYPVFARFCLIRVDRLSYVHVCLS
jgi:hypothetical protein